MTHATLAHTSSDPQQRLLLEAFAQLKGSEGSSWHTRGQSDMLESRRRDQSDTGVYVGVSQLEYARLTLEQGVVANAYYATGE